MKAITNDEKRALAKHLAEHDPEALDFLKAMAKEFGKLDEVIYEKGHFPYEPEPDPNPHPKKCWWSA